MDGIKEEIFETFESCDDPMEVNQTLSISMEERNPWVSKDLREFVFYHCPECEFQSPMENQFYHHAVNTHEKAKEVFEEPKYCDPFQEDKDPPSKPVNDIDWYVFPNQPPNSVHTLTNDNLVKDSTMIEEKLEDEVAKEYGELHLEPLYQNSIQRAETFIEELKLKDNYVKSETKKKELLIHKENGMFPCPFKCRSYFESEQALRKHLVYDLNTKCIVGCKSMNTTRAPNPRTQTCFICDKNFSSTKILKNHMISYHGGISCHLCGNAYNAIDHLHDHILKRHNNYKAPSHKHEIVCEHCGKSFAYSRIKQHVENFHTEGEFMCEECGESFQYKSLLATHQSKHNNVCNICGKQFKHAGTLTEHKKTAHQDNSKRYCEFCQKIFVNGAELFKHFNESHPGMECPAKLGVEFFQCENCHKILASQTALYTHYKLTHKIIYKGLDLLRMCDNVPTKCPECHWVSNSFMECVDHYLDSHGLDLHKELKNGGHRNARGRHLYCNICDFKTFKTMSYFNHRKLHR